MHMIDMHFPVMLNGSDLDAEYASSQEFCLMNLKRDIATSSLCLGIIFRQHVHSLLPKLFL